MSTTPDQPNTQTVTTVTMNPAPVRYEDAPGPAHPFGLPMGSVRGIMALLIVGFFWFAALYPGTSETLRLPLGHFFLLPLVLYSFTLSRSDGRDEGFSVLPFALRLLVMIGTMAVAAYIYQYGGAPLKTRLTPAYEDFSANWLAFSVTLAAAFFAGHLLRVVLGSSGDLFKTLRAWLSVVGLVMLALDFGLLVISLSSRDPLSGFADFQRAFQFGEVGVVAAYYGSRL